MNASPDDPQTTIVEAVATSRGAAHVMGVSATVDPRVVELNTATRRLADIVLSATSDDDLAQALDEALVHDDFQRFCELRMGVMFSLRGPVEDPSLPIEARKALLASCYTIIAVVARDVAIADARSIPPWLFASLDRYAQEGLEAVRVLPPQSTDAAEHMKAKCSDSEQRIEELCRRAEESGLDVFWPYGEPHD